MPSPMHPAKPLATGVRITGAQRESLATELALRYAAGESIRSLADSTGRSYGFVQALLKESGVEFRARGGATRGEAARARQQSFREAAAAVPRIATGLAVGGQPAIADPEMAEKARKRASKVVKNTPGLTRSDVLKADKSDAEESGGKKAKKKSKDKKKKKSKGKK